MGGLPYESVIENARIMSERIGLEVHPVECKKNKNGAKGCIFCHRTMTLEAARRGWKTYIGLELHAIPSNRFSIEALQDACEFVNKGKSPIVSLCIMPVPEFSKYRLYNLSSYVWKRIDLLTKPRRPVHTTPILF